MTFLYSDCGVQKQTSNTKNKDMQTSKFSNSNFTNSPNVALKIVLSTMPRMCIHTTKHKFRDEENLSIWMYIDSPIAT